MNLISSALFSWYVPRSHHESLKTLAHSYLEQLEGYENEILQARRVVEANKIMASYIKQIALEGIFDKVDDEDLETDHFYKILLSQTKATRASREGLIKDIRKIAAIALGDGELEESPYSLDEDELNQVLTAIANLRVKVADLEAEKESLIKGQIEDLMAENRELRAREANYIDSLQLSQKEVKTVQIAFAGTVDKVSEFYERVKEAFDKLGCLDQIQI